MPPNLQNYWKAEFIHDISGDVIDAAVDGFSRVRSPNSSILFFPIRGTASRVAPTQPRSRIARGYHVGIYALWTDKTSNAENIAWVRQMWTAMQPFVPRRRLRQRARRRRRRRPRAGGVRRELRAAPHIKARYDPDNMFCLNANITPARTASAS